MRNLKWCSLIKSQGTNEPSLSKIAALTAYVFASFFFIWHNFKTGFTAELWLIYLAIPAGHNIFAKAIAAKAGANTDVVPNNPEGS